MRRRLDSFNKKQGEDMNEINYKIGQQAKAFDELRSQTNSEMTYIKSHIVEAVADVMMQV